MGTTGRRSTAPSACSSSGSRTPRSSGWLRRPPSSWLRSSSPALREGYHGDTLGSVSVGGVDLFHEIFRPLLFECLRVPAPYAYRWPTGPKHCLEAAALAAESMIHGRRDEIAAMVIEPLVMGAAGMITHPPGYLRRIARSCKENGVLLICDEVATGFGRTGTLFAC